MKRKLLFAAALVAGVLGFNANAQENVTSKWIDNPSFEESTATTSDVTVGSGQGGANYESSGWKLQKQAGWANSAVFEYGSGNKINNSAVPATDKNGNTGKALGISFGWKAELKYQSVKNAKLPAGTYVLTADVYNASNVTPFTSLLGFISDSKEYTSTATNFNANSWSEDIVTFTIDAETEGVFQLGGKAIDDTSSKNARIFIDNITLLYFENEDALKLYEAKASLANVLEVVKDIPTNNVGDGAFQISTDKAEDLTADLRNAIKEAQDVYDSAEPTIESVTAAEKSLIEYKEAYENEVYNNVELNVPGDELYNIINISAGYGPAGNALTFKAASNANLDENSTAMGWTEKPGSIFPQGVKFIPVEDVVNGYILSYTRADGEIIYVGTGASTGLVTSGNDKEWKIRPTKDRKKALTVKVGVSIEKDGVWYLYNTRCPNNENGRYYRLGGNGSTDSGFFTGEANSGNGYAHYPWYDMKIALAEENTANVNIAADKYSTVIVPFEVKEIDADIYSVSKENIEGDVLKLQKVEDGVIKANTPYIVYADKEIKTLSGIGAAYNNTSTFNAGLLTGTYAENEKVPAGNYVLQTAEDGSQAFYVVEGDFEHTQYRAYLNASAILVKPGRFIFGDDATAIKTVPEVAEGAENAVIYNLAGQRVATPTKGGIYIVNGQKVLVK